MLTAGAAFGFAVMLIVAGVAIGWIGSRRILLSPYPGTPFSALGDGWRGIAGLTRAFPVVILVAISLKLFQIFGYSVRSLTLGHLPRAFIFSGAAIELIFVLAWAAVALRIDMFVLQTEITDVERRARMRRAAIYAFIFWGLTLAINVAGILLFAALKGNGRIVVMALISYLPYLFIILSSLTRPAISVGVPKPFRECLRILRENWFGISVTLALGALPLGFVFLAVGVVRETFHLSVIYALLLEVPIAVVSAISYALFEGVVAAIYLRIM